VKRLALWLIVATMAVALPVTAWRQQQEATDPAQQEVRDTLRQAQQEIQEFTRGGGKATDPVHPAVKWSAQLWELGQKHKGTPAGAQATGEAVHVLIHAERIPQALELADRVPLDDPAWTTLLRFVFEAANLSKDYSQATAKAKLLLERAPDAARRAALQLQLGRGYWQQGQREQAVVAFESAVREAPGSDYARDAESALYELIQLATGQPAPQFTVQARDGRTVALDGYRGRAVVLIFWSST